MQLDDAATFGRLSISLFDEEDYGFSSPRSRTVSLARNGDSDDSGPGVSLDAPAADDGAKDTGDKTAET